jgi:MYXO-CTERM domain-containing protein
MRRFVASAMVAMAAAFGPLIAQAQRCDVNSVSGACLSGAVSQLSFGRQDTQEVSSWSNSQAPAGGPAPGISWLMALGFLGIVVLRRTRSGPMM